jgi:pyridoxal phosphate enzyme (YggS family)
MISGAIADIRSGIARACARCGRDPGEVTLVAVAKTFPAERVREAVEAGVRDIGENYVRELQQKREALRDEGIRWHFIGHLQSNKAKLLAGRVHLIHALESMSAAEELHRRAALAGTVQAVLVEVNTTDEPSKFGVSPGETLRFVRGLAPLDHLRIDGLMTIGPFLPDPESSRPMFRILRELRDEAALKGQGNAPMRHLSMGMTGDYEVAVEEGATIVRIGTAIFGARTKPT